MNRIGEKIKILREESKMTKKALGKKLGVSENFINEIELGRKVAAESFIEKVSKVFGKNLDDINMYVEEQEESSFKAPPKNKQIKKEEANIVWDNALSSILKNVPVYKMDIKSIVAVKQLPLQSNKIEGFAQDKVFFLKIDNDDLLGFRIQAGDVAFAHFTQELENNAILLIENNSVKVIRQVKKLDSNKLLLISNERSIKTETVNVKDIKIIAKLDKIEITL